MGLRLVQIKQTNRGWTAFGEGWAVRAKTQEEALRLFEETQRKYEEIDARPLPPAAESFEATG